MQLSIKGKQVDIGDALRTHIDTTLPDAIGKYFDNTTDATVTISKDGGRFAADIQVHVSKRVLVHDHGAGNDAYGALEEATEHVTKRLRRYKRRLRDHKGRLSTADALPALQYVLQAEPEPKEDETNEQDEPIIVAEMPNATEFQLHIFAALAQEERRLISERTRSALAEAKKRGVVLGSNGRMLAERNRKKALEVTQTMEPIISGIFGMAGGLTLMLILAQIFSVPAAGSQYTCSPTTHGTMVP